MTREPDDANRIEAAAEEYGLAVNKYRQERLPQNYISGEPRPWLDKPDFQSTSAFKAGVAWRDQNCSPEMMALVEAVKAYIDNYDLGMVTLERAVARWEEKRKGK